MSEEESLLKFPCQFPIKVMGKSDIEFDMLVIEIIRRHAPNLHEQAVTSRLSKNGNYLSVTATIEATSRAQLDSIYQDLSGHPHVLMTL